MLYILVGFLMLALVIDVGVMIGNWQEFYGFDGFEISAAHAWAKLVFYVSLTGLAVSMACGLFQWIRRLGRAYLSTGTH